MEALELKADARKGHKRQVKKLRQQGFVPGVIYGKGVETEHVQIEAKALQKVLSVAGSHQLISLQVGQQRPQLTLAREIQRDPIKRNYIHVDFFAVKMDEKVTAQVPVVLIGEAPAIEQYDGILTHGLDEIEIECLPADLINSVEIDVSTLAELNDTITVADLKLPDTITILSDPDSMLAKIEPPRTTEALEALEEEAAGTAEPEVVGRAKEEEADKEDED